MNETKRLTRSQNDRMIGGVCGGLGEYFGIDSTLIRLAFALLIFLGAGSPVLAYLLLWIIIPLEGTETVNPRDTVKANVDEMVEQTRAAGREIRSRMSSKPETGPSETAPGSAAPGATEPNKTDEM